MLSGAAQPPALSRRKAECPHPLFFEGWDSAIIVPLLASRRLWDGGQSSRSFDYSVAGAPAPVGMTSLRWRGSQRLRRPRERFALDKECDTTGAEARLDWGRLRGAEGPLFHVIAVVHNSVREL
jgi:hypothetical protein